MSIDVVSTPAAPGHGCEWCPCTAAEEAAHPEWHDHRCPRNCTAEAEWEVAIIGHANSLLYWPSADRSRSRLVCDDHSVSAPNVTQ